MADNLDPAAVERAAREYAPDPVSTRDVVVEATDTLAGWLIGSGYYATSVGVDEAREMADALAAAGLLAVTPGEVPALAEIEAAYCETSGTDDERRRLRAEFRAWLAEHDAQVSARAWDEGREAEALSWKHVFDGHPVAEGEMCGECEVVNPYRKGQP